MMQSATVLLVEDEPLVLLLAQDVLEEAGFNVIPAEDGATAYDLFAEHPEIDLLLTDVNLPNMDGRELARRAKEQRPEILLIVASARHRLSADEIPGGVFLPKPYSPYQLVELVRSELDRRAALRGRIGVERRHAQRPVSSLACPGPERAPAPVDGRAFA